MTRNSNVTRVPLLNRNYLLGTVIIICVVLYGGLYPFEFRVPAHGIGPIRTLLATWQAGPGRADFLANILFFMPFGLFMARTVRNPFGAAGTIIATTICGAFISTSIELTQYYIPGRVTDIYDASSNTLGGLLGAALGIMYTGELKYPPMPAINSHPIPAMLLASWLGYRLYPYVPVIDLHKYWNALKPLLLAPQFDPARFFRQAAFWITAAVLIEAITGTKRSVLVFPVLIMFVFGLDILIDGRSLSLDELLGAAVACCTFTLLSGLTPRNRIVSISLLLAVAVIVERLEPFQFGPSHRFGWIPFYSFMHGSIDVDVQAFLEKFFLYGSLIWLLARTGVKLPLAAGMVAAMLVGTSWAETYLPGRSAEITDGFMALVIAVVFSRLKIEGQVQSQFESADPRFRPTRR